MSISPLQQSQLSLFIKRSSDFILFVARRLYRDHCAQTAASLTYTSLLAVVPFLVVGFAILREFPLFPDMVNSLQTVVLQVFTPDVGTEVKLYIQTLVNKGTRLPVLSLVVLVMTVVMMLYTVDDTLNRIWRVDHRRRTLFSLAIYLTVVISGPLLLGCSLAISTYLLTRSLAIDETVQVGWLTSVPWLVTFIAFTAVYHWVPNTRVRWKHAVIGGLLAMLLFELAKWGFAQYIKWVPTYGLLYGTLAAIPLTLVWIYLSWLVVLVGAETTRCLEVYNHDYRHADITAKRMLSFLVLGGDEGVSIEQVASLGDQSKKRLVRIFTTLQTEGLVVKASDSRYRLTDRAQSINISELELELTRLLDRV